MVRPPLISSLLNRAERVFGDRINVSCEAGRGRRTFTSRELSSSARRLGAALGELSVV